MTLTKIKRTRISPKIELIYKSAYLTNDRQQLVESENEPLQRRLQISPVITTKENYQRQTPAPTLWFSDWSVNGGEKRRIEACQSEAKNNKYGHLKALGFLF